MGPMVVLFCCFAIVLLVPVGLFLATYIFRLSCRLCGLPQPGVLVAAGKMFVSWVALAAAIAVLRTCVHAACDAAGVPHWEAQLATWLLALPVDLVISSSIHAGVTHIHYGKAVEVWFVQRLIQLSILVAVLFVAALVYLVQAMNG